MQVPVELRFEYNGPAVAQEKLAQIRKKFGDDLWASEMRTVREMEAVLSDEQRKRLNKMRGKIVDERKLIDEIMNVALRVQYQSPPGAERRENGTITFQ